MARPWIAPQFNSLFSWGRPPLPWDAADRVSEELAAREVHSIGVAGSLSPSVLVAVGYNAPEREINVFTGYSQWKDGMSWCNVIEDSPGLEGEVPMGNPYLPVHASFWDGGTPFFDSEALFIDLPFGHRCVQLKLEPLSRRSYKVILLGFLEGHAGPHDILDWVTAEGYQISEHRESLFQQEQCIESEYLLVIAANLSCRAAAPAADARDATA